MLLQQECTFKPALVAPRRRPTGLSDGAATPAPRPATEGGATAADDGPDGQQPEAYAASGAATPSAAVDDFDVPPPTTAVQSAAGTRDSAAHRSIDHSKYTSLEAQVRGLLLPRCCSHIANKLTRTCR